MGSLNVKGKMPYTIINLEHYATAEDGADLRQDIYVPDPQQFPGPRPAIIIVNSGGFASYQISSGMTRWAEDGATKGYVMYLPHLREDNTRHWIPGQTVNGIYPTQINDCKRCVLAALADPRCNGQIIIGGGSGGASIALYVALDVNPQTDPVPWDQTKRPLACAAYSPATDFSDRTPSSNLAYFVQTTETWSDTYLLALLYARSPVSFIVGNDRPIFVVDGGNHDAGEPGNDTMPATQRPLLTAALDAQGDTNYTSIHLPDGGHAFANYAATADQLWPWVSGILGA
jgi:acetyl esterase/lipase